MLPAYLATGFRHRGGVVPATLVFGAGVATLAGWKPNLPMPGARGVQEGSFGSAYVLGAFSGAASACCAPVLAGVAVLSGAAASFPAALAIGLSYVAGMVAPLVLVALVWDHRRERATRLLTDRTVRLRLGRWQRRIALGSVVSGLLMIGMGVLAVVLAFTGPGMPSGGWQTELSAWLQHLSSAALTALSWISGWVLAAVLVLGFALLLRRALRTRAASTPPAGAAEPPSIAVPRRGEPT
ncbi:MAG: cytochrome c biogenesis protein CcdA [Pseudonocardiaceae bacterium]